MHQLVPVVRLIQLVPVRLDHLSFPTLPLVPDGPAAHWCHSALLVPGVQNVLLFHHDRCVHSAHSGRRVLAAHLFQADQGHTGQRQWQGMCLPLLFQGRRQRCSSELRWASHSVQSSSGSPQPVDPNRKLVSTDYKMVYSLSLPLDKYTSGHLRNVDMGMVTVCI